MIQPNHSLGLVKSTAYSSKDPELNSQQLHGGSESSAMISGDFLRKSSSTKTRKLNMDTELPHTGLSSCFSIVRT